MDCIATHLPYGDTGYFSPIVIDYINGADQLKPFYCHPVSHEGIFNAIKERKKSPVNRALLVTELIKQYTGIAITEKVRDHISLLAEENSFTVCTAHQPAIFTGSLFFIYKILHIIKLAESFNRSFPGNRFVPVFYMGSEDADLDELGNIFLGEEKVNWKTTQKGAIGRMKPEGLETLIQRIKGEFSVLPFGEELVEILEECYGNSPDIQTATLKLINRLFGDYGLIVLIPDNAAFKKVMLPVFEEELFKENSSVIVSKAIEGISRHYKAQAHPRSINLFYLLGDLRERIERKGNEWVVVGTDIRFTADSLRKELQEFPERFSPNVILRGLFQETILPDIAFVGGGGEIAYWLELKELFEHYHTPYPALIVRNSFLVMEEKWRARLDKLGITAPSIFKDEQSLLNGLVKRESQKKLDLLEEINGAAVYYNQIKLVAQQVDNTLVQHVAALQSRAIKPLQELEKKLLRAEKRKFEAEQRQLNTIKKALFPLNGLQERVDNILPFYARWGKSFIDIILKNSLTLEQEFTILTVKE
ncbi:MAG: bacillithiol biosynthesis cysteine-adding enzyme BshC [Flavitalea sp.]